MLYCYGYCFNNNIDYGGACGRPSRYNYSIDKIYDCCKLCKYLNIPEPIVHDNEIYYNNNHILKNYNSGNFNEMLNENFRNFLYEGCKTNINNIKENKNDFIVAIHIRRGDVTKDNRWSFRYVDDKYYLKLIDVILKYKPSAKIYIFSESKNVNFEKFKSTGCVLKLDTSLIECWDYFIMSDIFLMGNSAFSIVPAIIKRAGMTIYHENKYFKPLNNWIDGDLEYKSMKIKKYLTNC